MQSTLPSTAATTLPSAPLGPSSLTHQTFSDLRMWLLTQRTGMLQAMHPVVGQALADHSDLLENPVGRLLRSAAPVLGVVVDPAPEQTGTWVRDMHKGIKGRGYHSLHPEVFFWTHATFFESQITMRRTFGRPFAAGELEQLYAESVTWWRRYGMTDRVVPPSWSAFEAYWAEMVSDVLVDTPVVRSVIETPGTAFPSPMAGMVERVWPALAPAVLHSQSLVMRGTLPPEVRARLGLTWTAGDRAQLAVFAGAVRAAFAATPPGLRSHPWARSSTTLRTRAEQATGRMALRIRPQTPRGDGEVVGRAE